MHAADAPPAFARDAPFPLIAFSHCMDCVRFSMFTVAEQLASRGFVVAAPDHLGGTIYDGTGVLTSDFLRTRANDIRGVVDALLDPTAVAVPVAVRGKLDAARVGAFGHSYGSITTGLVLQSDARIKAGIMIAAPPESALLSGVTLANIRQPGLFFEALEDNSITVLGNAYIESNYADYPAPARLIQVADAGHWSFTDIAGLGSFDPGCGNGQRMANPLATFRYLDNDVARTLTKSYVTAFFVRHLLDDLTADAVLNVASPPAIVTVKMHN
jgi:predicted dienelactone hydrolase